MTAGLRTTVLAALATGLLIGCGAEPGASVFEATADWHCAQWCLLRGAPLVGVPVTTDDVERVLSSNHVGHSFEDLRTALLTLGVAAKGRRVPWDEFVHAPSLPAIVHLRQPDHFVVALRSTSGDLLWLDGAAEQRYLKTERVRQRWSGFVLQLARDPHAATDPRFQRNVPAAGPRAQFAALHLDAGLISPNVPQVEFTFTLQNVGDAPLVVTSIDADCSCFRAEAPGAPVPPGGAVPLTFRFATAGGAGNGLVDHSAVVRSNDPRQPALALRATGYFDRSVRTLPQEVNFGSVVGGETASRSVFLQVAGEAARDCAVTKVVCGHPLIRASVAADGPLEPELPGLTPTDRPPPADRKVVEITLALPAPETTAAAEELHTHVQIHLSHPQRPTVDVPVRGRLIPRIRADRDIAVFRKAPATTAEDAWKATLVLVPHRAERIQLETVELAESPIAFRSDEPDQFGRLPLHLEAAAAPPPAAPAHLLIRMRSQDAAKSWELRLPAAFLAPSPTPATEPQP